MRVCLCVRICVFNMLLAFKRPLLTQQFFLPQFSPVNELINSSKSAL